MTHTVSIDCSGVFDYGSSDHWGNWDFKRNTWSRIDKYTYRVQDDHTPMPHLLAGGIGRNDGHMCAGTCSENISSIVSRSYIVLLNISMII